MFRLKLFFFFLILFGLYFCYADDNTETVSVPGVTVTEARLPVANIQDRSDTFIQTEMANSESWQSIASTVPGVVVNPFGNVHVRGDHNLVTFSIDGMMLPVTPEGELGSLIDPRLLKGMDFQTGSYDASLSGQLGTVIGLTPLQSSVPSQFEIAPTLGDHAQQGLLGYWAGKSPDNSWHYFVGGQSDRTGLRLEAPQPANQTLNNTGNDSSGFVHVNHTLGKDTENFLFGRQITDFGIPNTPSAEAAGVNQHERNVNNFALFSWNRDWNGRWSSNMGFSWLSSTENVTNNGIYNPFVSANPVTMPNAFANGLPANPIDYGSPYLPAIYRNNSQLLLSASATDKLSEMNHLEFGGRADFISYHDDYHLIDAGGIGRLPSSSVNLSLARSGFDGTLYITDHFTIGDRWHIDYGINAVHYDDGFAVSTSQINPVFNAAYALSWMETLRFSYDHLFNAPPLEPDLTGAITPPEDANVYELNYEDRFAKEMKFILGGYIKNFANQIDGALLLPLSNIPLFTPASFPQSFDDGIELSFRTDHPVGLNGFLNYAYAVAESPAAAASPAVFLDHDQRHTLTFGTSYRWKNGYYAEADNRYGSGFPQSIIQIYNQDGVYPYGINGNNRISNFITDLSFGYRPKAVQSGVSAGYSVAILNLFNCRRDINFISDFTGTRFVEERQFRGTLLLNF